MKTIRPVRSCVIYPDETDTRIAELEREVESLQKKLKNQNQNEKPRIDEIQNMVTLQKEIDILEDNLRRQNRKYTRLEEEAVMLRTEVEMLNMALNRPALKEENLVEILVRQMETRTDELHMSRTLILELQNAAFSDFVEDKVVAQAKSVLYDNNSLRKTVTDLEMELLISERKMNEISKHSGLISRMQDKQKIYIEACKERVKELANEKVAAVEEVESYYQKKEAMRLAQENFKINLLQEEIKDLRSQVHTAEINNRKGITLPPLTPQNADSLIIKELQKELQNKNELISEMKTQLSSSKQRSDRSSSRQRSNKTSSSTKKRGLSKMKSSSTSSVGSQSTMKTTTTSSVGSQNAVKLLELTTRNMELEGEVDLLREQLKTLTEVSTQEINEIQIAKKQMSTLLQNIMMPPDSVDLKLCDMESKVLVYKKKLEQKESGSEKLREELRSLTKTLAENVDPQLVKELTVRNRELVKENTRIRMDYQTEMVKRKLYYNLLENIKGQIRVYVRVRPLLTSKTEVHSKSCVSFLDEYTLQLQLPNMEKEYLFDHVFTPQDDQVAVFKEVASLVQSAVDGYCVSIFALGQTGCGKSYTLLGEGASGDDREGIAPRTFKRIFEIFQEQGDKYEFSASVYILELYNDQLIDLLRVKESKGKESILLEIKRDSKNLMFVSGAEVKEVKSADELLKMYNKGINTRRNSAEKTNTDISRSHFVLSIQIESINKTSRQITKGKFSIIDLAGIDGASRLFTLPKPSVEEAKSINLSLSALGDVISALASKQTYVPYVNNKLTMLMQDSLGGNAKTLMFVNVNPDSEKSNETFISLSYATRVKLITNDPLRKTESERVSLLEKQIEDLELEVVDLKDQLFKAILSIKQQSLRNSEGHPKV